MFQHIYTDIPFRTISHSSDPTNPISNNIMNRLSGSVRNRSLTTKKNTIRDETRSIAEAKEVRSKSFRYLDIRSSEANVIAMPYDFLSLFLSALSPGPERRRIDIRAPRTFAGIIVAVER